MVLYSFLLPTRNRADLCILSIKSIYDNAIDKKCFEILLAFDNDDASKDVVCKYCDEISINYNAMICERYGYRHLNKYINKLCEIAKGDMLWLWNDDAKILTFAWDEKLHKYGTDHVLDFPNNHYPFIFPLVPAKYIKEMGHFSLQAHNDTWIAVIFHKNLGIDITATDIVLYHARVENNTNINYTEVNDDTTQSSPEFDTEKYIQLRLDDTNKIISRFFPERTLLDRSTFHSNVIF